ncbi:MAG TPA: peptidylprolyl isomerase [Methanosarcinales archaeon]|nr:peptidylprolyl isomerase [Methanosarcinales archaeon]
MMIEKGDFIKIEYTGKREDGSVFDTTSKEIAEENKIYDENVRYGEFPVVVGAGHTLIGLDEDFVGKEVGYEGNIEIPPEKGFGDRKPDLIKTYPISIFKETKPFPGMQVNIENKYGVVTKVIGRRVRVDFNHQLAGKTLFYDYKIVEKIDDNREKIRSLIYLYAGKDMDIAIEDKKVTIDVPSDLFLNSQWLLLKSKIATEILKYVNMEEVVFADRYTAEEYLKEEENKET